MTPEETAEELMRRWTRHVVDATVPFQDETWLPRRIAEAIREAVDAEQERCAKLLEAQGCSCAEGRKYNVPAGQCPHELAELIRARSDS